MRNLFLRGGWGPKKISEEILYHYLAWRKKNIFCRPDVDVSVYVPPVFAALSSGDRLVVTWLPSCLAGPSVRISNAAISNVIRIGIKIESTASRTTLVSYNLLMDG